MRYFVVMQARRATRWLSKRAIPPFSTACIRRIHAAIVSFQVGAMLHCPAMICLQTMKGMFGQIGSVVDIVTFAALLLVFQAQ